MEENTTLRLPADPARERALDWLTALLPVLMISLYYYRRQAVVLELLAIGGYLMAAFLLPHTRARLATAAVTALLAAFCLPAAAPFWLAALIGALAAVAESAPILIGWKWPDSPLAMPILHPVAVSYLLVRVVFPGCFTQYTLPAQWVGVDTLSFATPLAAFHGQATAVTRTQLFFGIRAGAVGETCTAVLLLSIAYLLIRRRIRVIAPAAMLAALSFISWIFWNSPLYALLAGGTALAVLLLADCTYAPRAWSHQLAVGIVAGTVTVLWRRFGPWTEGFMVGLLAAEIITPLLTPISRLLTRLWQWMAPARRWIAAAAARFGGWAAPRLRRSVCAVADGCRRLFRRITKKAE